MSDLLENYATNIDTPREIAGRKELYKESEPISIDFAVLENAENVLAIKGDIIWDDVGSWNSLERYKEMDHNHNVIIGEAKICDSYETTIYNENGGVIVTLGVSDLVVVKTDDIVLVAHKTKVNDVKKVLKEFGADDKLKKFL
jgi:mannose-1-phosphate guanylyltransferase